MNTATRLVGVAVAIIVCGAASGIAMTGNQLLELCNSRPDYAIAYISGVIDTVAASEDANLIAPLICYRPGSTRQQATDIVCADLRRNSTFRDFPATVLVSTALSEAFPCR